jgi:hypothetical protein
MIDKDNPHSLFSGAGARCPKCGAGLLRGKWMPKHTAPWLDFRWTEYKFSNDAPEWMLRTCVGCGFRRAEMCLDAK